MVRLDLLPGLFLALIAGMTQLHDAMARPADDRGLPTLSELFAMIAIATALMVMAVARNDAGSTDLAAARESLMNDLRVARMQATLNGARVRFEARETHYTIFRLMDRGGSWNVDGSFAPKRVELPAGYSVSVDSDERSPSAEFDSRGLLVPRHGNVAGIVSVTVRNDAGQREIVHIWPSGQIDASIS